MDWRHDRADLTAQLEAAGYDVDESEATLPGGGSLTGRRDRGGITTIIALDAGGRVRATTTQLVNELSSARTLGDLLLHELIQVSRATTVRCRLADPGQLRAVLAYLDGVFPAAHRQQQGHEPGGGPW